MTTKYKYKYYRAPHSGHVERVLSRDDSLGSSTNWNRIPTTEGYAAYTKELKEILANATGKGQCEYYAIIRHVAASGMSRIIDFYVIDGDRHETAQMRPIGRRISELLDWPYDDKRRGVRVGGCGMDMVFHTLYELHAIMGWNHAPSFTVL